VETFQFVFAAEYAGPQAGAFWSFADIQIKVQVSVTARGISNSEVTLVVK